MKPKSILIIDDNEIDTYTLKRHIKKGGLSDKVFASEDGRSALDFLQEYDENIQEHNGRFPPDLIFLDINMPLMDGFEFLENFEEIKKSGKYESSVIMMFSSSDREDDKQKALSYDFVKGYITKMPDTFEELLQQIEGCCPHFTLR